MDFEDSSGLYAWVCVNTTPFWVNYFKVFTSLFLSLYPINEGKYSKGDKRQYKRNTGQDDVSHTRMITLAFTCVKLSTLSCFLADSSLLNTIHY